MDEIDVGGGVAVQYDSCLTSDLIGMEQYFADHKMVYIFEDLRMSLFWIQHEKVPRKEYFVSDMGKPYAYGSGAFSRTYHPQPWTGELRFLQDRAQDRCGCKFEVCFLNYYETGKDQLGWHSDDSPEMDDERPIVIITFGAEREIWFRQRPTKETVAGDIIPITKLTLQGGSICIMPPGMQDTHQHRIPKAGVHNCGPRISLTFRGYVDQPVQSA